MASLPTKTDPSSHRPRKKRALSPTSTQASHLSHLFAHPETEIKIPPIGGPTKKLAAPPEIVTNVQGSSAGAGSGEFHVYKAARRREYERLRQMDEEVAKEKEAEEFEKARREREQKDEERTRKNREKREKKKNRGKGKKDMSGPVKGTGTGVVRREVGKRDEEGKDGEDKNGDGKVVPVVAEGQGLVIHDDD
ncbi:hypothetical protein OQA88_12114 [Cercophora sp. LCS_1]